MIFVDCWRFDEYLMEILDAELDVVQGISEIDG